MNAARLAIDPARVSPSRALAATARAAAYAGGPLVAITGRAYLDLVAELGSDEAAARHLARLASNTGRPILVNVETGPDTSRTFVIGPKGWTEEKTAGWIAAHHTELERALGDATPIWEDQ